MSDRLTQMRQGEVARLRDELAKAIERIKHYRATHPAVNELYSGYYLDGSTREGLEDWGGSDCPTYRMWRIGDIFGRSLLIYEDIDREVWSVWNSDAGIGIDSYGLALTDPAHGTYHNATLWIGKVDLDEIGGDSSVSLDTIVWMSDLLSRFFSSEAAFREAVDELTSRFVHKAQSKLAFT